MRHLAIIGVCLVACGGSVGSESVAGGGGFSPMGGTAATGGAAASATGGTFVTGGTHGDLPSPTGGFNGAGGASGGATSTGCVNETYRGGTNDCSYGLPLPCAPCFACNPLPVGDNSGCAAPTGRLAGWQVVGVDPSLRYPLGCTVFLPEENPFYPGGPQTCDCDDTGPGARPRVGMPFMRCHSGTEPLVWRCSLGQVDLFAAPVI